MIVVSISSVATTPTVVLLLLLLLFCASSCHGFPARTTIISSFSSSAAGTGTRSLSTTPSPLRLSLPKKDPPYLALITNRNSCDSKEQYQKSCATLQAALKTQKVDWITVRITPSTADPTLVQELIRLLVNLDCECPVIVHQDWIEQALEAKANGIQIKEDNQETILNIRHLYAKANLPPPIIGMTVHSIQSALMVAPYQPDYLYVGSCFVSGDSHPEKQIVEGPALPGLVAQKISMLTGNVVDCPIPILGIGGIEVNNCHTAIQNGAHGVTAIKSVLQSKDPASSVLQLCDRMNEAYSFANSNDNHRSRP